MRGYSIVSDAVESAIEYGYNKAHKHTDTPSKDEITEQIHLAVMQRLDEIFDWE